MSSQAQDTKQTVELGDYQFGFAYPDESVFKTDKGISPAVVNAISDHKGEPDWMRQFRLRSLEEFQKRDMPNWGADLSDLRFEDMVYYSTSSEAKYRSWEDVPESIKETYERIGIPEAERKFLAGVGAQYDSEVVYHNLQQQLADKGVVFSDPETAVKEHPDIVKKYFGTIIPYSDNKFAALNSAFWSGGSFVYVPPGVEVDVPLQAYFRINSEN
ncbi:MAG: Fe-S cluster assembly protein SufB, partial [Spirochaetota bacterium]